jgi:DNA-binding CsgD family transcriptional regulator
VPSKTASNPRALSAQEFRARATSGARGPALKDDEFQRRILGAGLQLHNAAARVALLRESAATLVEAQSPTQSICAPVVDPARLEDFPIPPEEVLKRLYDLTPAEARLAQGLAGGDSLDEVASGLGIRITTARTQLAAIFAKTDTRRQAKLVAVLCHLAHLTCYCL